MLEGSHGFASSSPRGQEAAQVQRKRSRLISKSTTVLGLGRGGGLGWGLL